MALQENNLLDNRLPLLKLRALRPCFKAKGALRSKQEEEATVELPATDTILAAAAAAMADLSFGGGLSGRAYLEVWWFTFTGLPYFSNSFLYPSLFLFFPFNSLR